MVNCAAPGATVSADRDCSSARGARLVSRSPRSTCDTHTHALEARQRRAYTHTCTPAPISVLSPRFLLSNRLTLLVDANRDAIYTPRRHHRVNSQQSKNFHPHIQNTLVIARVCMCLPEHMATVPATGRTRVQTFPKAELSLDSQRTGTKRSEQRRFAFRARYGRARGACTTRTAAAAGRTRHIFLFSAHSFLVCGNVFFAIISHRTTRTEQHCVFSSN